MTFGRKVALIVAAVLVIGVAGPYVLLSTHSHGTGVHVVQP
jgi:hypothetical protein